MNEEKIKSAIELALEKTERIGREARAEKVSLTEEMRKEIDNAEKEYQARIAEKDIMLQAELRKLHQSHHPAEAEQLAAVLRTRFGDEKRALQEDRNRKIEEIRKRGAPPGRA